MNKKIIRTVLLIMLGLGSLYLLGSGIRIYFLLTGTPWERAAARKQVEVYLQKRFTTKMVIEDGKTGLRESPDGGFYYWVHPQGRSDLSFIVLQAKRNSPDFTDEYYSRLWETEADAKIQAFLQTIYPMKINNRANVHRANFSSFPQWRIELTSPPSFVDISNKVSEYDLYIRLSTAFDKAHPDLEYARLYRVVQFLKESNLVPGDLFYGFSSKDDKQDPVYFDLYPNDFRAITSVQTMMAILKRYNW
jgi:hypothetical protein